MQVSGIKFAIDTDVPSSVQLDDNGMFAGVAGTRRVREVYVLDDTGAYVELDTEKTYSLASRGYILREFGDGYSMFSDNTYVLDEGEADTDVLISYLASLNGKVSEKYCEVEGRIRVD
ncbi:MAG: 5'-nucleotidase C-terminal domain-containing protein [Roseburia sp.]